MKLGFIGNCQANLLQELARIGFPEYQVPSIKPVHLLSDQDRAHFLGTIDSLDLVLSHQISDDYHVEFVRTSYLKDRLGSRLHTITNVYTSLYNGYVCWVKKDGSNRLLGPLDGIHLSTLVSAYQCNLTPSQALEKYLHSDHHEMIQRCIQSVKELERRDRDFSIDLPFASRFCGLFKVSECLHSFHHPTPHVIHEYLQYISDMLGLRKPLKPSWPTIDHLGLYMNKIHVCPHPHCALNFDFGFSPSTLFKGFSEIKLNDTGNLSPSGSFYYSLAKLIEMYWNAYDLLDLREGNVQIGHY